MDPMQSSAHLLHMRLGCICPWWHCTEDLKLVCNCTLSCSSYLQPLWGLGLRRG